MTIVLARDGNGREILWQCTTCGLPFTLGWGSQCNRCIAEDKRHAEMVQAINQKEHTK